MLLLSLTPTGCTPATSPEPGRIEGTEPGDCSDGADNDADGMFDSEDDCCAGSSDCVASDRNGYGNVSAAPSMLTPTATTRIQADTPPQRPWSRVCAPSMPTAAATATQTPPRPSMPTPTLARRISSSASFRAGALT